MTIYTKLFTPSPEGPQRNDILALVDPFTAHQLQYQRFIHSRYRSKVEGVQAFNHGEFCLTYASFGIALFTINTFQLAQS